jgi:8-oxo-dGTP pyrophosphatase MutT (NUDIX family)
MTLAARLRERLALVNDDTADLMDGDDFQSPEDASLVDAAVLIAITDRTEPGALLTVRTANLRKHAGQVAFPGGRTDPQENSVQAALREAHEEIGLHAAHVDIVGEINSYRTMTGFLITPVIGVIPPDLPLRAHEAEVKAIFEAPLAHLLHVSNYTSRETEYQGFMRRYYELFWNEHRIWGATAAILVNLAHRMKERS